MKKKFAVVTGTRAEYGLLRPLIKEINKDMHIETALIVTGAHLSDFYGKTIDFIKEDGFKIDFVVDMELKGDKETEICHSMAIGLKKFSSLFSNAAFDGVIILGDRYELLSVCTAAVIHRVPIVHIHGGEVTEGAIDDTIRHAITKMTSIHFPSLDIYRDRIIQMGENPERVYSVGSLAIDNMREIKLMNKEEISQYTGINFKEKIALMTYHPVTLNCFNHISVEIKEIMKALVDTNLIVLITMPNADMGSQEVYSVILEYMNRYPDKFQLRKNLGQKAYLSSMKYAAMMIGNSSSGISESPYFKLPVVNVGERQKGRLRTPNIIDCEGRKEKVLQAIHQALSEDFKSKIQSMNNPYGDGTTAKKIANVLKQVNFKDKDELLKKGFYDLTSIRMC
ncbi:GDP/UDP-N,N'-diacetylbacillosamine 2-epimerase (hydrolysing) [Natronincola peptidivorans]|uniref:GDP/UDP-N,N'-diacetylbacillosamine 2-epimerase (Hydrolysing) n=1 Tax=Natronincola peptidivorans TaxID=426128 RepID=A0A1H9ZSA3_9FIRM|nr:UDP-N-acetylglucosamine 2-epimerase [Natronincola peptidivorans]SES84591.1 GDP/UDP-N,N'-diacetylbacillosamine 2-epimerase (hydrolysing) [Natronincola peptidivorans]